MDPFTLALTLLSLLAKLIPQFPTLKADFDIIVAALKGTALTPDQQTALDAQLKASEDALQAS